MNIVVMFGSKTTEHDVSVISGITVFDALKKNKNYKVFPLYIDRNGQWFLGGNTGNIEAHRKKEISGTPVSVIFAGNNKLVLKSQKWFGKTYEIDFVLPIFHGLNGEDGTVQGVLELSGVAYGGPGVLSSAIGMNKIVMKDIFTTHNIPQVKYRSWRSNDFDLQPEQVMDEIIENFEFPVFVKPANLGSSIGITKVDNPENKGDLRNAIEVATHFCDEFVIEQGVEDLMEINCAVVGDANSQTTSLLEEPVTMKDFLTFEEKYIDSGGTMRGVKSKVKIPAELPEESMTKQIQSTAKRVFWLLRCSGVARIDFLVDTEKKEFYVNEINTIPGSLQAHLWEKSKIPLPELLERMIKIGIDREREKDKISFAFSSEILSKGGAKK